MHPFLLRLPPGLWEQLRLAARENHRSIQQEILYRLRLSLEGYRV